MASPQRVRNDDVMVQFNTRITLRMRNSFDDYLDYMDKPLDKRPEETENWPTNIVKVVDDALTTFFAEHPKRPRLGPKVLPKPKSNNKKPTNKKTTKTKKKVAAKK